MSLVCLQYSTEYSVLSLRIRNGLDREQLIEICSHGSKYMGSSQRPRASAFSSFFTGRSWIYDTHGVDLYWLCACHKR